MLSLVSLHPQPVRCSQVGPQANSLLKLLGLHLNMTVGEEPDKTSLQSWAGTWLCAHYYDRLCTMS